MHIRQWVLLIARFKMVVKWGKVLEVTQLIHLQSKFWHLECDETANDHRAVSIPLRVAPCITVNPNVLLISESENLAL